MRIPDNWALTNLASLGDIVAGGTPDSSKPEYFEGDIAWITPADLSGYAAKFISAGRRSISEKALEDSAAKLMPPGSVHFSSRAPIGYVVISKNEICTNQGFKSLVPNQNIFNEYVYYYLKASKQLAESLASGTTFLEISGSKFSQIPTPLPPLAEQHRIVAKIEELFSDLDAGIASLKKAKEQLKTYRQTVLRWAFEGKLTEDWRAKNLDKFSKFDAFVKQKTHIEFSANPDILREQDGNFEVPNTWFSGRIGNMFQVCIGSTPSRKITNYWNGKIPWVSSGEVAFCRIKDTREKITETGFSESSTDLHPIGTVLLAMIGEGKTRGQPAILDIAACNNQNSAAIRVSETGFPPEFLYYFLMFRYAESRKLGSGNNQPALNKNRIQSMPFPLTIIEEQRKIVSEIESRLSEADNLDKTLDAALAQSESLRQSILKQAFEGKLVPQDPNDEPAEKLLERIRAERAADQGSAPKKRGRYGGGVPAPTQSIAVRNGTPVEGGAPKPRRGRPPGKTLTATKKRRG